MWRVRLRRMADCRYLRNEATFKEDAYASLSSHFTDRAAFERFYGALPAPERRNDFLRVCTFYRHLAKHGDWKVSIAGCNEVVDYLTNSHKLVSVFALIESLSDLTHMDFHDWMVKRDDGDTFPISDKAALRKLYDAYKAEYGAIRRCVEFFGRLDEATQRNLCSAIRLGGKPAANIKKLAEYLYLLRSKFVHEAQLVLELGDTSNHIDGRCVVRCDLSMSAVFDAFEQGLLAYFREIKEEFP